MYCYNFLYLMKYLLPVFMFMCLFKVFENRRISTALCLSKVIWAELHIFYWKEYVILKVISWLTPFDFGQGKELSWHCTGLNRFIIMLQWSLFSDIAWICLRSSKVVPKSTLFMKYNSFSTREDGTVKTKQWLIKEVGYNYIMSLAAFC